jgi:hypothetical protein
MKNDWGGNIMPHQKVNSEICPEGWRKTTKSQVKIADALART